MDVEIGATKNCFLKIKIRGKTHTHELMLQHSASMKKRKSPQRNCKTTRQNPGTVIMVIHMFNPNMYGIHHHLYHNILISSTHSSSVARTMYCTVLPCLYIYLWSMKIGLG
jgi:hypothetical protein